MYDVSSCKKCHAKIVYLILKEMDVEVKLWYMPHGGDPKNGTTGKKSV